MTEPGIRLGVDIGASKVSLLAHLAGDEVYATSMVLRDVGVLKHALEAARRTISPRAPITAVGVSSAGFCDAEGRICCWPNRPEWVGVDLRTLLTCTTGCPPILVEDGQAAALAELPRSLQGRSMYIGLGSGVSSGAWVDGDLDGVASARHSFQLGHMRIDPRGAKCRCGRSGCLQAYVGGEAALAAWREVAGEGEEATWRGWREAVTRGDAPALKLRDRCAEKIAAAIDLATSILDLDLVVLGGRGVAQLPGMHSAIRRALPRRPTICRQPPRLKRARYPRTAALRGALLAIDYDRSRNGSL